MKNVMESMKPGEIKACINGTQKIKMVLLFIVIMMSH